MFAACSKTAEPGLPLPEAESSRTFVSEVTGRSIALSSVRPNAIIVKVNDALARDIEVFEGEAGGIRTRSVSSALNRADILKAERVFPDAGIYEERTREAGLHRWYRIEFDGRMTLSAMEKDLSTTAGIEKVDFDYRTAGPSGKAVVVQEDVPAPSAAYIFNDPMLAQQWHYINDGSVSGSVAGCDVNVLPVWEEYTPGNSEVIVSVVDGGVDYAHSDLADNMWKDASTGACGFNFITNNTTIVATDHGTHVAGTIAAVNNNGLGVCGIAGGDAQRGIPGVRIMSCQIFNDGEEESSGPGHTAIKWSADHGAVISQNSWGYVDINFVPDYCKEAIDYFVRYAGMDPSGRIQTGPMAGGIVIFAAGNENANYGSPAAYENVLAVSALAADYRKAYYSNFGDWCDIAAPGGDAYKRQNILSTLPNNKYGQMQGTSMACPHVSGVAALVVANMAGDGFTADRLKELLLQNADETMLEYNTQPLGVGLVNAGNAVNFNRTINHTVSPESSNLINMGPSTVRQLAFTVRNPTGHRLNATLQPHPAGFSVSTDEKDPGRLIVEIDGRTAVGDKWAVRNDFRISLVVACDQEPEQTHSADFTVSIEPNQAPVLLRPFEGLAADRLGKAVSLDLGNHFFDSDGGTMTYTFDKTSLGTLEVNENRLVFTPSAFGTDEIEISASDSFGATVSGNLQLLVRDGASRTIDLYPNPVLDYLHVRASASFKAEIVIRSVNGAVIHESVTNVSPFAPGSVDMRSIPAGVYSVTVKANGIDETRTIVKI